MDQSPQNDNPQQPQSTMLTRRQALKALAAATGAVVLSNLPTSWKTPVVEVGVLPAHAQGASGPAPQVSQLTGYWDYPNGNQSKNATAKNANGCIVTAYFAYQDSLGQVNANTSVLGTYNLNQTFGGYVGSGMNGTGFAGNITFPFNSTYCTFGNTAISVQIGVNGRWSNITNGTIQAAPS